MARDATFYTEGRQIFGGSEGMYKALGALVSLATEAALADGGSLYVVDGTKQVLVPCVTVGLPEIYVRQCGPVAIGDQCCGRAALHKSQWIVKDMLLDPLFASARAAAEQSPVRAAFSTPVIDAAGCCIGSLASHFFKSHTPSDADLKRNKLWAGLIAHAIEENRKSSLSANA